MVWSMPARRTPFCENSYYHVYNRGVEKRKIFLDENDYKSFIGILRSYLSFPVKREKDILQGRALRISDHRLYQEIKLLSYCLMPNHFHLLVKQNTKDAVTKLMRRVLTAYSMYFNEKYERVGGLFQGRFKAKEVETDEYLLHLSRYIHRNPLESGIVKVGDLQNYPWSTYTVYLGKNEIEFVKSNLILDYFNKSDSSDYQKFVEFEQRSAGLPKEFLLE